MEIRAQNLQIDTLEHRLDDLEHAFDELSRPLKAWDVDRLVARIEKHEGRPPKRRQSALCIHAYLLTYLRYLAPPADPEHYGGLKTKSAHRRPWAQTQRSRARLWGAQQTAQSMGRRQARRSHCEARRYVVKTSPKRAAYKMQLTVSDQHRNVVGSILSGFRDVASLLPKQPFWFYPLSFYAKYGVSPKLSDVCRPNSEHSKLKFAMIIVCSGNLCISESYDVYLPLCLP